LVHRSSPNQSSALRIVAMLALTPKEISPLHYHLKQTALHQIIEVYQIDEGFFIEQNISQRLTFDRAQK
jgi:hypothetical protein